MALKIDGEAVKQIRLANGWSLREVAGRAEGGKPSYSYLSKLENRQDDAPATTPADTVRAVAKALGCDPRAITGNQRMFAAALKAAKANPAALRVTTGAAA